MDQIDEWKAIIDGELRWLYFSDESLDCGQEEKGREGVKEER
jgi:hypothetical protein